ncbi:MAG: SMP-30/gluconolactonase/LRE family protein [Caulobacteraceae bacterium]
MDLDLVTDGLQFPEGPMAMADGSVVLVEIQRKTLTRVLPDGTKAVLAELGGGPNGAAIGPDGAAYVVNNGGAFKFPEDWQEEARMLIPDSYSGGYVQRVDLKTGQATTLYDGCDGKPLNGPNDIVFDSTGGFWFTCFGFSDGENRRLGGVYYARPDGSKITRWRSEQISPNGVGLSPDERTLYYSDSMLQKLWAVDLSGPGVAAADEGHLAGRVLTTLPGFQWFDSLAVEAGGKVCVGTLFNGGVTIVDPETGGVDHAPFPDPITTNICFGGPDMRDAFVTCSSTGRLYRTRWPRPGLKLPFNA